MTAQIATHHEGSGNVGLDVENSSSRDEERDERRVFSR